MRRPRPALCLAFATVLTAACGGARAPVVDDGGQSTVRVSNDVGAGRTQLITTSNYRGLVDELPLAVDSVWALMPAVYTELGIDFTTLDQKNRVIGNDALHARQRLGKMPLSRYVSCGTDNGRDNADSYAVTMAVRTQLVAGSGSGTTVATTLHATARSLLFNSGDVACASTQRLEDQIAKLLKEKAGA
jgi:ribulose 1,5-bisphosphate carboxylase large subunit-like protein